MKNLIVKELKLSTSILTYLFLAFVLMTLIPGYPILCGAFFVCFGIFHSYQYGREANDIWYSVLLPVKKRDVVKAKYIVAVIFQMTAFILMTILTVVRMMVLADVEPYRINVMMAANPVFLAFVLLIFTAFNILFVGGFFKTAYAFGKPFVTFIIVNFVIIGLAETLHHIPGMEFLNDVTGENMTVQLIILILAAVVYGMGTVICCKKSEKHFENIDL